MRSRLLPVLIVLSVLLGSIASAHIYFIDRLVTRLQLPEPWPAVGSLAIAGMGVLILANPMLENIFGPGIGKILGWPAYIWFGSCMYLLFALWGSDLVLLVTGLHGVEVERTRALIVLAVTGAIICVGLYSALRPTPYKRVDVPLPGWPRALDGYRIVQITDVHIGSILRRRWAERLVARCNALQPDLTAVTGDLVDGTVERLRTDIAPFGELRARDGVYFVTGNHDYFSGADSWTEHMASLGMEVLRNRRVPITRDGATFEIAGVDDISSRRMKAKHKFDLDAALAGWNGGTPLVLLAHDPRTFELSHKRGISLQLSGHTHDGQLWPFRFMVRFQTRFLAGIYRIGGSALYVSRGTGFWGPPMRVLSPPEITELRLRSA